MNIAWKLEVELDEQNQLFLNEVKTNYEGNVANDVDEVDEGRRGRRGRRGQRGQRSRSTRSAK